MSWRRWWLSSVLVVMASLPGLLFTADPVARDQGVFATIGWRWLEGDVPYASAGVEHKGPLPFAAYALSQLVFGHSIQAARLLAWFAMVVTALILVAIARRLMPPNARRETGATTAGALYALIVGAGGLSTWWSGAQAESFMEPFAAGAVLLALGPSSLAAGMLLGVATLGKPLALLLVPALLAAGVASSRPRALRFVGGALLPWVLALVVFAAHGAAFDFIDQVFLVNIDYGRRAMSKAFAHPDWFIIGHRLVIPHAFLLAATLGGLAVSRDVGVRARLVAWWLIGAYAQVLVQGRFFEYHYLPIVAPLALMIGWLAGGFGSLARRFGGVGHLATALGAAGVLFGLIQLDWRDVGMRVDVVRGVLPRDRFEASLSPPGSTFDVQPLETGRVSDWLRANTPADSTVLVWGFEPAVNFLAERRSPTRFLYDWYLTSRAVDPARQERYWSIFWQEIEAAPPAAVVVVHHDTNPVESKDSAAQLAAIPRLAAWLADNYHSETRIGDFEVYRRARVSGEPGNSPRGE